MRIIDAANRKLRKQKESEKVTTPVVAAPAGVKRHRLAEETVLSAQRDAKNIRKPDGIPGSFAFAVSCILNISHSSLEEEDITDKLGRVFQ